MPSRHSRRRLVVAAGTTLGATTAGCLSTDAGDGTGDAGGTDRRTDGTDRTSDGTDTGSTTTREITDDGTYADATSGPKTYPDRPSDSTKDAAVAFVESFEKARTYNSLHSDDAEEVSVSATTHHEEAVHDGHYVLATTTGYANYSDGAHADWGQLPALYYVSPGLVVRTGRYEDYYSDCKGVFASDDPSENFAAVCQGGDASFRAYNVHPDAHTLSVTVEYLGANERREVLAEEYFLDTTGAIQQESVTYRKGTYRVTATLESGASATFDWELQSEQTYQDPPLVVLVEPTGDLVIRRVPFHAL